MTRCSVTRRQNRGSGPLRNHGVAQSTNAMDIHAAYSDWSATYDLDHNRTRDLDQQVTRDTLGNLSFKSILEIGCGTGKNTALLARIGGKVLALDFSEAMIE